MACRFDTIDFEHACMLNRHACDFHTHVCDFDMHECDVRVNITLMRVNITLVGDNFGSKSTKHSNFIMILGRVCKFRRVAPFAVLNILAVEKL
jgi:hypothetical protein